MERDSKRKSLRLSRLRPIRLLFAVAVVGACGISPSFRHGSGFPSALGIRPSYGPPTISAVPNLAAASPLLWMPGLDEGWDPQGLAAIDGSVFVSAYQSDRFGVNRGHCRVFRIDPATGHEMGHLDVPLPCGHAGGLAHAGNGKLYIADTHTLFEVDLEEAFASPAPAFRIFPLGPGLKGALAASGQREIWLGTYEEDRPGRIFRFDQAVLEAQPNGAPLTQSLASASLEIPTYAQGAGASDGRLWISRSEIGWGSLEQLDLASGTITQRYAAPGGIEGIAFDAGGRLWAVSEAGALHFPSHYPFFPVIFRLDLSRMTPSSSDN
ncbi:MAG: hypothetical protein WA633_16750 [Stellaceae bacterium]